MSSFVVRIARTLSQTSDGITPRRSNSLDEDPLQVAPHRLSMSPSFNDFSLNAQGDAQEEYSAFEAEQLATKSRNSVEVHRTDVVQCSAPVAACSPRSEVLAPKATTSAAWPATSPRTLKSRSIKVMGMDAYDYCELLRSSSL